MPKRAKKKEVRKEKAAGDSRLAVAPDAIFPLGNIQEVKTFGITKTCGITAKGTLGARL